MREIEIGGKKFEVRGLRLSEVSAKHMRKLGYGRFFFDPRVVDIEDAAQRSERLGEVMDAGIKAVLGDDGYQAVDAAGGLMGLRRVFEAVIEETYGAPGAEKNSSGAGSGSATPGAESTAIPAVE